MKEAIRASKRKTKDAKKRTRRARWGRLFGGAYIRFLQTRYGYTQDGRRVPIENAPYEASKEEIAASEQSMADMVMVFIVLFFLVVLVGFILSLF
ncbi:MAG: hypothetical protein J4432_05240 [DPANN group archaeon]|nr:hypothetical protein [DPANN group archaeon]